MTTTTCRDCDEGATCEQLRLEREARLRAEAERDRLDLERAKLLVERDIRRGRRLLDGTEVKVGQRVVHDLDACTRDGLAHACDGRVHEITSLLGGDCGLVECGPMQVYTGHLRLAPGGSEVSCPGCAGWRLQMIRLRADADAYRALQVDAFAAAARKFVSRSRLDDFNAKWSEMLDAAQMANACEQVAPRVRAEERERGMRRAAAIAARWLWCASSSAERMVRANLDTPPLMSRWLLVAAARRRAGDKCYRIARGEPAFTTPRAFGRGT